MNKKLVTTLFTLTFAAIIAACAFLTSCYAGTKRGDTRGGDWQKLDLSQPLSEEIFADRAAAEAAGGGWYYTVYEDFDYSSAAELLYDPESNPDSIWSASPHALRWQPNGEDSKNYADWSDKHKPLANWWCPDMIEVKDGLVIIKSETRDSHTCASGICPEEGRFTSGIETRAIRDGGNADGEYDELLFSQAFGYYECKVKLPDTDGMWSAFWLQSSTQRNVGNDGTDGTEIDIYESAFRTLGAEGGSMNGNALLWDGYEADSRVSGAVYPLPGTDLYDGFHTFALKWTPTHYVFYVDGVATWATSAGGVSRVAEFMRLTCEIDAGDEWGPHGVKIGAFDPQPGEDTNFYIDHVRVLQHTSF